ncbi:hypothetical protein Gotur_019267 [Gossypium turneri]
MRSTVSIIGTENISCIDLGEYGVVIIPDFVLLIDDYLQILTRMAWHTVNGVLHSFLTKDDSQHAGLLIEILEQCGQEVAEELRNLHYTRTSPQKKPLTTTSLTFAAFTEKNTAKGHVL